MLLNAALVEKISGALLASLTNIENGSYIIDAGVGEELTIKFVRNTLDAHWVINDFYFDKDIYSIPNTQIHHAVAELLIKLAVDKADEAGNIEDMFNGITTNVSHDSVIGLTVKFHCDVDSRRLMIAQTANPNNVLYALEEAANTELSIDPELMTSSHELMRRTLKLFGDYLLADLITHDIAL
jgi:hypothetical protein